MSRGPLEVLRDMRADATCTTFRDVCEECKAYDEAIAQVEALVEAARMASATLGHAYHTTLTGQLAEYAHSDYQKLDAALSPFPLPPGQDSEGGGNG